MSVERGAIFKKKEHALRLYEDKTTDFWIYKS